MRHSLSLFICAVAVSSGCAPAASPVTTSDIPLPPFVTEGTFNGGFESRIDVTAGQIRDLLASHYGAIEIAESGDFMPLDEGIGWPEVESFYDTAFGQPPFETFARQAVDSPDPDRYQLAVWSDGTEALGVAVVTGRSDDPLSFLLRFRTMPD